MWEDKFFGAGGQACWLERRVRRGYRPSVGARGAFGMAEVGDTMDTARICECLLQGPRQGGLEGRGRQTVAEFVADLER